MCTGRKTALANRPLTDKLIRLVVSPYLWPFQDAVGPLRASSAVQCDTRQMTNPSLDPLRPDPALAVTPAEKEELNVLLTAQARGAGMT